jgi:hypothetical protein
MSLSKRTTRNTTTESWVDTRRELGFHIIRVPKLTSDSTVHNPNTSDAAKEHAKEVLKEHGEGI